MAVIPCDPPGTALRVYVECGREGYVRLEQLAHDEGLGWYVQKSFTIPREALAALIPQLRKADCLIPRRRTDAGGNPPRLFPAPMLRIDRAGEARRLEA